MAGVWNMSSIDENPNISYYSATNYSQGDREDTPIRGGGRDKPAPTNYSLLTTRLTTMLSIRLSRIGKRKQPVYRLIVTEKGRDPWGRNLEILGQYNPRTSPSTVNFKEDRIKYYLSKGAQASSTVWNLLADLKLVEGAKRNKVTITKRRKDALAKKATA